MQERYLVEHVCKPLALLLPTDVEAHEGVVDRLRTHRHLGREALFPEMLQRTAYDELLGEVVFPVYAEHGLSFHRVVALTLKRDVDRRSCIDDALVEDSDLARRIIDGIIDTFHQGDTACRDIHAAARHVVSSQRYDVCRRTPEMSRHEEPVLLRHLLGGCLGGVIQFTVRISLRSLAIHAARHQGILQSLAERLCHREIHSAVAHRVTLHEVEHAIGVHAVVGIKTVGILYADDGLALYRRVRDIGGICTDGVALILHVELELLLLHRCGEVIHVLHHQLPVRLTR